MHTISLVSKYIVQSFGLLYLFLLCILEIMQHIACRISCRLDDFHINMALPDAGCAVLTRATQPPLRQCAMPSLFSAPYLVRPFCTTLSDSDGAAGMEPPGIPLSALPAWWGQQDCILLPVLDLAPKF